MIPTRFLLALEGVLLWIAVMRKNGGGGGGGVVTEKSVVTGTSYQVPGDFTKPVFEAILVGYWLKDSPSGSVSTGVYIRLD